MQTPEDSPARVPLGPVGQRVIVNLAQLREARGLTYRELAARLKALGRPIPVLGLSRIEKGARRVDADDLVALAVALGVNPSALLLPRGGEKDDPVQLAGDVTVSAGSAWEWASGRFPLVPPDLTWQRIADFEINTRPAWYGPGLTEWREEAARRWSEMDELAGRGETP